MTTKNTMWTALLGIQLYYSMWQFIEKNRSEVLQLFWMQTWCNDVINMQINVMSPASLGKRTGNIVC